MCTSIFIRFVGFDAVTLANNHLNDFGEKGVNFTFEVLKKTGVKYFGVTYGKYDTSQVSITCSDIQHWDKPKMLPISVKLLRRLCTSKRFSVLFSLLYVVYSSPKFLFGGLRIPLLPPPPWSLLRRLCLILLEICPEYLTAKQLGFSHWLRTRACKRAKERFGLRVKTENEFGALQDWFLEKKNSTVFQSTGAAKMTTSVSDSSLVIVVLSHSWRWTWSRSFLPLVLPWILVMVWFFFSLFISLAKLFKPSLLLSKHSW